MSFRIDLGRHGSLAAATIALGLATAADASLELVTLDPDGFANGTIVSTAFRGVTLSATGFCQAGPLPQNNIAAAGNIEFCGGIADPNSFGFFSDSGGGPPGSLTVFWDNSDTCHAVMHVEFAAPAGLVIVDFISFDAGAVGQVEAFGANGLTVGTAQSSSTSFCGPNRHALQSRRHLEGRHRCRTGRQESVHRQDQLPPCERAHRDRSRWLRSEYCHLGRVPRRHTLCHRLCAGGPVLPDVIAVQTVEECGSFGAPNGFGYLAGVVTPLPNEFWRNEETCSTQLNVEFGKTAQFVCVDFGGFDPGQQGRIEAYNCTGELIASADSPGAPGLCGPNSAAVNRSQGDIAKVKIFPVNDGVTNRMIIDKIAYAVGSPCGGPPPSCLGDLNGDGVVNAEDLAILLGAWGPCN